MTQSWGLLRFGMGESKEFQSGLVESTEEVKAAILGCGLSDAIKVKALKLITESDKNYKSSMLLIHIIACLIRSIDGKDEVQIPSDVLSQYWEQIKERKTFPVIAYQDGTGGDANDGGTVTIKW